jgi:hypothetical protein
MFAYGRERVAGTLALLITYTHELVLVEEELGK